MCEKPDHLLPDSHHINMGNCNESEAGAMVVDGQVVPTVFQLKVPWWIVLRSILFGPILIPIRFAIILEHFLNQRQYAAWFHSFHGVLTDGAVYKKERFLGVKFAPISFKPSLLYKEQSFLAWPC